MSQSAEMPFAESAGMLQAWVDALPNDIHVALFTGVLSPTQTTSYDEVIAVKPVGSWYAPISTTMEQDYRNSDGNMRAECKEVQFSYSGSDTPELLTGYALICPSTTRLLCTRRFDTPVQLNDTYDSVNVSVGVDLQKIIAT